MVKRLFLSLSAASLLLAGLAFLAHVAIRLDPTLAETWISSAGTLALLGFMPAWACALVVGVAYGLVYPDLRPQGDLSMHCRACGYILVGLSENRCPECSRPFDPTDPRTYVPDPSLNRHHRAALAAAYAWLVIGGIAVLWLILGLVAFTSNR